jgi:hypothetical protein
MLYFIAVLLGLMFFAYQLYRTKKPEFLIYMVIFFYAGFALLSSITTRYFTLEILYLGIAALLISISALYSVYPLEKYIAKLKTYLFVKLKRNYMGRCIMSDIMFMIIVCLIILGTGFFIKDFQRDSSAMIQELTLIASQATSSNPSQSELDNRKENISSDLADFLVYYISIFFIAVNLLIVAFYSTRYFIYAYLLHSKASIKNAIKYTASGYMVIVLFLLISSLLGLIIRDIIAVFVIAVTAILFIFISFHISSVNYEKNNFRLAFRKTWNTSKKKVIYSFGALSFILFFINFYMLIIAWLMHYINVNIILIITLILAYIYISWIRLVYFNISTK